METHNWAWKQACSHPHDVGVVEGGGGGRRGMEGRGRMGEEGRGIHFHTWTARKSQRRRAKEGGKRGGQRDPVPPSSRQKLGLRACETDRQARRAGAAHYGQRTQTGWRPHPQERRGRADVEGRRAEGRRGAEKWTGRWMGITSDKQTIKNRVGRE